MSQDFRQTGAAGPDKLELHHRQQLSALVDGALAPDEARFLLRRLEHDHELAGCYERWQLGGDILRRQFRDMAATGFSDRVAAAIQAEAAMPAAAQAARGGRRLAWGRWGGGAAALAASVAAVALLVNRPQAPVPGYEAYGSAAPALAADAGPPAPAPAPVAPPAVDPAPAAAAPVVLADATPVAAPSTATARPQQVVREPLRVVASNRPVPPAATAQAAVPEPAPAAILAVQPSADDPFASAAPLHARPWPRAVLPQSGRAYTASSGDSVGSRPFYPFEPGLPAAPAAGSGEVSARQTLPEPPAPGTDPAPR